MSLSPISQKAHDISYAVFRCAAVMSNSQLKAELESAAVDFASHLDLLKTENSQLKTFSNPVDKLERLISLAESIGELKTVNAMVIRRELGNIQTAIDLFSVSIQPAPSGKDLNISDMFAASTLPNTFAESKKIAPPVEIKTPIRVATMAKPTGADTISSRQTNILRLIREVPFCRLRNILESMPDVSERTVRNDIQSLIENRQVKRIGGGGPNSYFEPNESRSDLKAVQGQSLVSI